MGIDNLFVTKCIAIMDRIKSRDLYDLLWMIQHEGKGIEEVFTTIQNLRAHINYETIRYRLLDWPIPTIDEGINANVPITVAEVRSALKEEVDRMEIVLASSMVEKARINKI